MLNSTLKAETAARWLYVFIFLHIFCWTLAPTLVRLNLPMDALEGTIWGHQLELGYDKNPFLNGWLTYLAIKWGGYSGWMTYFFSQLSVGICLWATWKLASKLLPPIYALLAVLLLECMQYYNLHAIDFNDNTLELSLWALTILFFYQALTSKKYLPWLLTGLFAAFGMLTKYYTLILLLAMLLFLLTDSQARQQFKSVKLYLALLLFLLLLVPHTYWLFKHDFVTVRYALQRVSGIPSWLNHGYFPLQFAWQQIEVFLPALLLFCILLLKKKPQLAILPAVSPFNKKFLFYVGLGPLLLTLLLSLLFGMRLRAGWGQPLLSLTGIMLCAFLPPTLSKERLIAFITFLCGLTGLMLLIYCGLILQAHKPVSANFPGQIIAATLTEEWHQKYHTPLRYVAGPRWLAGNIALYSPDHPAVYMDWNNQKSSWIDEQALQQAGAIFVWDPTEATQVAPAALRARFVRLGPLKTMHFTWLRNSSLPPVEFEIAFLPPLKK